MKSNFYSTFMTQKLKISVEILKLVKLKKNLNMKHFIEHNLRFCYIVLI